MEIRSSQAHHQQRRGSPDVPASCASPAAARAAQNQPARSTLPPGSAALLISEQRRHRHTVQPTAVTCQCSRTNFTMAQHNYLFICLLAQGCTQYTYTNFSEMQQNCTQNCMPSSQ